MLYSLLVGAYTETSDAASVFHCQFDDESKECTLKDAGSQSQNASFLDLWNAKVLSVNELKNQGYIDLYDRQGEQLILLDRLPVEGSDLCHIHHWPGTDVFSAADYTSGDFVIFAVKENKLNLLQQIYHHGVGFDAKGRQEGPHVHSTILSPDGEVLYVADLGLDTIYAYQRKEDDTVTLLPEKYSMTFPGGQGPRHMAFSPDGSYFFAVTEMGGRLYVFRCGEHHVMEPVTDISILPEGFEGDNLSADLHVSADGRFVYASNRGADTIAAFAFSKEEESIRPVGQFDVHGQGPRNFCISENGCYLFVANQYSGNLTIFSRDSATGRLSFVKNDIAIQNCVFVKEYDHE